MRKAGVIVADKEPLRLIANLLTLHDLPSFFKLASVCESLRLARTNTFRFQSKIDPDP